MRYLRKFLTLITDLVLIGLIVCIVLLAVYKPNLWIMGICLAVIGTFLINSIFALYTYYSNRNDVRKKSWILFFATVPIIAPFVFLWFGYNPFTNKDIKTFKKAFHDEVNKKEYVFHKTNQPILDVLQTSLKDHTFNNLVNGDVKYIERLEDTYFELLNLIRSAKKYIVLNYFIIGDGIYFRNIINELKKKKDEGVEIIFVYDWVWSRHAISSKTLHKLNKEFGFGIFKPKGQLFTASRHNNRNHKKYVIVDGIKAIYGGSNLADEYINQNPEYNYWFDTNFIISGDIVKALENTFLFDYKTFVLPKKTFINNLGEHQHQKCDLTKPAMYMFESYPEDEFTTCLNIYKMILPYVKEELIISTPYLYPTKELDDLIRNAIARGIKIKLLLPGLPDNKKIIVWLNRSQYKMYLDMGIEIYELNGFNHGKFWIIDRELTLLTSVNLDPRAMIINYETSIMVKDKSFNAYMNNQFLNLKQISEPITLKHLEQKQWKHQANFIKYLLMLFEPAL